MKIYFVVVGALVFIIVGAYHVGIKDGKNKCVLRTSENIAHQQIHLIHLQEKINANTVKTATGDIRRVLREQYTIAE